MEKTLFEEIYSGVSIKNITFAMVTQLDEFLINALFFISSYDNTRIQLQSNIEVKRR